MEIQVLASGSTGNAYTISDGSSSLLLDAGIPLKALQIGTGFKLSTLSGALITHEHKDHSKAVRDLARLCVDVYASAGTLEACGVIGRRLHPVRAREEFQAGTFKVLPFEVEHDAREPLGFLCASAATGEKLLYFTDTYFVRYRFRGLNHIMAECNYTDSKCPRNPNPNPNQNQNQNPEDSAEPPAASAPETEPAPAFQIPLNDGTLWPVTGEMLSHWRQLYPAVDVEQEIRNMIGWCEANPQNRKTARGAMRFVNGWLSREQNRGGTRNSTGRYAGYGGGYQQSERSWADVAREMDARDCQKGDDTS